VRRPRRTIELAIAACIIAVDCSLAMPAFGFGYGVRGFVAVALFALLSRWRPPAAPLESVTWWGPDRGGTRRSLVHVARVAVVVTVASVPVILVLRFVIGPHVFAHAFTISSQDEWLRYLAVGCVAAPFVEEFIYRGLLYPRLRAALGATAGIVVGGLVFWGLHWVYHGGPSPANQLVAGWILTWSYERTKSLLAPTLLHALGNAALLGLDTLRFESPDTFHAVFG